MGFMCSLRQLVWDRRCSWFELRNIEIWYNQHGMGVAFSCLQGIGNKSFLNLCLVCVFICSLSIQTWLFKLIFSAIDLGFLPIVVSIINANALPTPTIPAPNQLWRNKDILYGTCWKIIHVCRWMDVTLRSEYYWKFH